MLDGLKGDRVRLHALVLDDPEKTLTAVRHLRREGYGIFDVHSPFPVHGMPEAMGIAESRVSRATLLGGTLGVSLALGFQAFTSVVDWPLDIGGKSNLALPALAPVTFELGVLLAAFFTVGALLVRSRLVPRRRPPSTQPHEKVTDDRFVVLVREDDARFDLAAFRETVRRLGVETVVEGWRVS